MAVRGGRSRRRECAISDNARDSGPAAGAVCDLRQRSHAFRVASRTLWRRFWGVRWRGAGEVSRSDLWSGTDGLVRAPRLRRGRPDLRRLRVQGPLANLRCRARHPGEPPRNPAGNSPGRGHPPRRSRALAAALAVVPGALAGWRGGRVQGRVQDADHVGFPSPGRGGQPWVCLACGTTRTWTADRKSVV